MLITYHNDWLFFVYFEGSVYCYQTELWPEHGESSNWANVLETAVAKSEWLWNRGDKGTRVENPDGALRLIDSVEGLRAAVDRLAETMTDVEFAAFLRR